MAEIFELLWRPTAEIIIIPHRDGITSEFPLVVLYLLDTARKMVALLLILLIIVKDFNVFQY